jgi:hypothetical protein
MLNFIKRTVPFLAVFVLSGFVIGWIIDALDCSCNALRAYASADFYELIIDMSSAAVVLVAGVVIYFLLRNKFKHHKIQFKYIYWVLLPLLILWRPIYNTIIDFKNRDVERAICKKSEAPIGGRVISTRLNLQEYEYLTKHIGVVTPFLPASARDIDVKYYGDDFLGDFMLNIVFTCSLNEKIAKDENWGVKSVDKMHSTQQVYYSSHMQ